MKVSTGSFGLYRVIALFIEDDEVEAGHVIGQPALLAAAGHGLKAFDQVDDIVEPTAGAIADQRAGDGDREVGFARDCSADQCQSARKIDPLSARNFDPVCCVGFWSDPAEWVM